MTRRKLLALILGTPAAALGYYYVSKNSRGDLGNVFFYLDDIEDICAIGDTYLSGNPEGTATAGDFAEIEFLPLSGLEKLVEADHADGNTGIFNGWVISHTEAKLAAALCLSSR